MSDTATTLSLSGSGRMGEVSLSPGERELLASEQMRDRIVAALDERAAERAAHGGSAALTRARWLTGTARFIASFPGRLAQVPDADG